MATSPETFLWLNGAILPENAACLSPFDHGFTLGNGIFETLIAYHGTPFAPTRHWQRLAHSGTILNIPTPSKETLDTAYALVTEANQLAGKKRNIRLRVTVTSGTSRTSPTILVTASPAPSIPPPTTKIVRLPWSRNENAPLTGAKTTSYADNIVALAYAKTRSASEGIFANTQGHLCEGTSTNIFFVQNGTLRTPSLASGPLPGVTRILVINLATDMGIPISEEPFPFDLLPTVDEAFLTSTTREVQAISHIDDILLPSSPGPITQRLHTAFQHLKSLSTDP